MMITALELVQRVHNAYCAILEYRELVVYLDLTTIRRRYLCFFCHRRTKGVEEGTFIYPPLNGDVLEPFLIQQDCTTAQILCN